MNEGMIVLTASPFNSLVCHVPKLEKKEWLLTMDYHSVSEVHSIKVHLIKALIPNT